MIQVGQVTAFSTSAHAQTPLPACCPIEKSAPVNLYTDVEFPQINYVIDYRKKKKKIEMAQKYMLSTQGKFQNELNLVTLAEIERDSSFNRRSCICHNNVFILVNRYLE